MSGSTKDEWVERVFGVKLATLAAGGDAPSSQDFETAWPTAVEAYRTANDTVDGQISLLQGALKKTSFPFLHRIADAGLNGVTGNFKVPVQVAIQDIAAAGAAGRQKAAGKARSAIDAFAAHLDTDPRIAACDRNPFDVAVTIRQTLGSALKDLRATLGGAA